MMKMKMKNKLIKKYGIWDAVTSQGLSSYPNDKWDATLDDDGFHLFDSKKEAIFAAHELTKIFRKHQTDAKIE